MESSLYVITAGPCAGKSTLCAELFKEGYHVVPEVARRLIEKNQKTGGVLPWTDFDNFQRAIIQRQKINERAAKQLEDVVFLDRAIPDTYGYYIAHSRFEVPQDIRLEMFKNRYSGVFILDPLPNYVNDAQRVEDATLARRIHEQMYGSYFVTGLKPVIVPFMPVRERVKFILEKVIEHELKRFSKSDWRVPQQIAA